MCYLREEEIRTLRTREELQNALDYYRETDEWIELKADEMRAFGVSDYPLLNMDRRIGIEDEEAFDDCVSNSGIFLSLPLDFSRTKYRTLATRYTSLESLYNRSGTNCRIVRTLCDRRNMKAMPAEERGEIINKGLLTSRESVKVLVSDGRVSFIGSEKYVILPYHEGIETAEQVLKERFSCASYISGYISHEFIVADYRIEDPEIDSYRLMLTDMSVLDGQDSFAVIFRFSSSNIGDARMSGRLFLCINGCYVPIGHPKAVWHLSTKAAGTSAELNDDNGASIESFRSKLTDIGSVLKENEDLIEAMGNTPILHPDGCLEQLLKFCPSIPAKKKEEAVINFTMADCTAMDVYLAVCGLLSEVKSLRSIVQATEEIAELPSRNFRMYDRERT